MKGYRGAAPTRHVSAATAGMPRRSSRALWRAQAPQDFTSGRRRGARALPAPTCPTTPSSPNGLEWGGALVEGWRGQLQGDDDGRPRARGTAARRVAACIHISQGFDVHAFGAGTESGCAGSPCPNPALSAIRCRCQPTSPRDTQRHQPGISACISTLGSAGAASPQTILRHAADRR